MLESFLCGSAPCCHNCITSFLSCTLKLPISCSTTSQRFLLDSDLVNREATEVIMSIKPVWDNFCFVTWRIILLELAILGKLWHKNHDRVKSSRKCSHTIQSGAWAVDKVGQWYHAVLIKLWPKHLPQQKLITPSCIFPVFISSVMASLCSLRLLVFADRSGTQCCLHLPQPICLKFWLV